ncbi:hypothetical protein VQ02_27355 [Methylobacterium variabile]|jgi:hypothetical protein|uniref:Uncharacterized protein n=1 Tax=Methylobacterium variabile TaxID=298794 RepID=A0A0J6SAZ6_9HYPH|nr:hypothetical protein [Methylobacterium variabile]KMO30844.1 hypothetical protein VQ02_27355 [Methylobacterium variabile]
MDGVHDRLARAAATGALRRAGAPGDGARPALCRVRAACRLCGFSVHGFLNGMTCVLQVDGRALRDACREAGAPDGCGLARACAGLQEAVRAARRP